MDKLIYCDRNDVSFAAYDDCLDYNDGGAVGNGDDSEKDGDVNDNFNDAGNDDGDGDDDDNVNADNDEHSDPLAQREAPAEGANLDRSLVPYHAKCMRIQYHIEFIYLYICINRGPFCGGVRRLGRIIKSLGE